MTGKYRHLGVVVTSRLRERSPLDHRRLLLGPAPKLTGVTEPDQQLHRSLRNRHIQLIALGGAIGTGLFYGAADSISAAGPAIVISYLVGGAVIYLLSLIHI